MQPQSTASKSSSPFIKKRGKWRPLSERFWEKVDKSGECWLWIASLNSTGYGQIAVTSGRPAAASRVAWLLTYGAIPEGLEVCHRCDVKRCVRPDHLFLGTHQANMRDAWDKGLTPPIRMRDQRGMLSTTAKLTDADVLAIRALRETGLSYGKLATQFGVAMGTIADLLTGKTWTHI